jgi:hypothetical protein
MTGTGLSRFVRALGPWLFTLLVTAGAFDISYQESRAIESVLGDNLLAYNELLTWRQLGDPLTSFTLTPSPYFIDLLFQLPIALLSDDFERFAYWEALGYGTGAAAALIVLFRSLGASRWASALSSALTMTVYFLCFPQELVLHLHVPNHTSEVIGSILGLALLVKLTKDAARPLPREYALFGVLVFVSTLSSTFFFATFLVPALGALAVVAIDRARRRTALALMALAVVCAAAGTTVQALVSAYWWPIRKDIYLLTLRQSAEHLRDVLLQPNHRVAPAGFAVGVTLALVLLARSPRARRALCVPLVFYLVAVISCLGLPVARGAFQWTYSFRFLQVPALGSVAIVVACAVRAFSEAASTRRVLTRVASSLLIAGVPILLSFFRGPLTESSARSMTAPLLACMRSPEHLPLLEDGLASVLPARFMNASFRGPARGLPNLVVEIERWHPPSLVSSENNISWFRDGYRKGAHSLNFVVTFQLPTESLAWLRRRVGEPDIVFRCPLPADWRPWRVADRMDEQVETWVWTSAAAKKTLREMVLEDNMRGLFVRPSDHEATIGAKWGMNGTEGTELVDGSLTWRRGEARYPRVAWTRPMFAPAGRYRADVELQVEGLTPAAAHGVTITAYLGAGPIARVEVPTGARSASFEYVSQNPGGAVSGFDTWFVVDAEPAAVRVAVHAIRLTRLEAAAVDPLRVFR